jgi:hypothetical protein
MTFFHQTPFSRSGPLSKLKGIMFTHESNCQIVESNNGNFRTFVSESDVNTIEVTNKISLGAINEIIQTLEV